MLLQQMPLLLLQQHPLVVLQQHPSVVLQNSPSVVLQHNPSVLLQNVPPEVLKQYPPVRPQQQLVLLAYLDSFDGAAVVATIGGVGLYWGGCVLPLILTFDGCEGAFSEAQGGCLSAAILSSAQGVH